MEQEEEICVRAQFSMTTRMLGEGMRPKSEFKDLNNLQQEIRITFGSSICSHFGLQIWTKGRGGSRRVIATNADLQHVIFNTRSKSILFYAERATHDIIGIPEIENRLASFEREMKGLSGEIGDLRRKVGDLRSIVEDHLAMGRAPKTEGASAGSSRCPHDELQPEVSAFPLDQPIPSGYPGGGTPAVIKSEGVLEWQHP